MESTERIAKPPQFDLNGDTVPGDGYIALMRDFLAKPRVARDFQDLKADAQRLRALAQDTDRLSARAAEAELEAGRMARSGDEHRHQRLTFGFGVLLATLFVALDALPANLAAQTFGLDVLPTWGITVTHYKSGWRRIVTIAALSVGLLSIGALRYWFLWVTAGDALAAVLEAVALTIFTSMMVWLGILVLSFTRSRAVSAAERAARRLRRKTERLGTQEVELGRRFDAAKTEFLADAQLYSFRAFQSEARRNQFLDYVRAELDR